MIFDDIIDKLEKSSRLPSVSTYNYSSPKHYISTGSLCVDLIIGGGLKGGVFYEITGPEHGGKTTLIYHIIRNVIDFFKDDKDKPFYGIFINSESIIDKEWFCNIVGYNFEEIFGVRDSETGNWKVKPKMRYYRPQYGEQALKLIKEFLVSLPQKMIIGDKVYYAFIPNKFANFNITVTELKKRLKGKYVKSLYDKLGVFCVHCEYPVDRPEFVILIDSLVTLQPKAIVQDDSEARAIQARMFAKYINSIKNDISSKGVTLIGTNQIRMKPDVMFGNPEDNPGGNALKHAVDCRIRISTYGKLINENGNQYKEFKAKTVKNKIFIPFRECNCRFWISNSNGQHGSGIDPIEDTLSYLRLTNQISSSGQKFSISIHTKKKTKKLTYKNKDALIKDINNIRELCKKQLRSGIGLQLYVG